MKWLCSRWCRMSRRMRHVPPRSSDSHRRIRESRLTRSSWAKHLISRDRKASCSWSKRSRSKRSRSSHSSSSSSSRRRHWQRWDHHRHFKHSLCKSRQSRSCSRRRSRWHRSSRKDRSELRVGCRRMRQRRRKSSAERFTCMCWAPRTYVQLTLEADQTRTASCKSWGNPTCSFAQRLCTRTWSPSGMSCLRSRISARGMFWSSLSWTMIGVERMTF
mmetsp:Transcript_13778/g.32437  ORF Transcript_13778/g.32437 Transcript_13778/m.32437 type:complete len:217 (-) Transcript_13778:270-920(-)